MEISSQMVKQKVTDGLRFHRIPEEDYLLEADGVVIYEVPQDVFNLIKTNSDFREGVDYKVIGRKPRVPKASHVRKPRPTLKQMVARGLVEPARRNLRTPTA